MRINKWLLLATMILLTISCTKNPKSLSTPPTWQIIGSMPQGRTNFSAVLSSYYVGIRATRPFSSLYPFPYMERWDVTLNGGFNKASLLTDSSYSSGSDGFWSGYPTGDPMINQNHLYLFGNYKIFTDPSNKVKYTRINKDGSLGLWQSTTSMLTARVYLRTVTYNNVVYAIGGYTGTSITNITNSVEYAKIQADGSLGKWEFTSPMNLPRAGFEAVAFSGWVYAIGGITPTGVTNTVELAKIQSDGTLGSWQYTSSMITSRTGFGIVEYNNRIYALGGRTVTSPIGVATNTVEMVDVNSDGLLSAWRYTMPMNSRRSNLTTVMVKKKIYVIGGDIGYLPWFAGTVEYATINSDGGLTSWQGITVTSMIPQNTTAVSYKNYIYLSGGGGIVSYNYGLIPYGQIDPLFGGDFSDLSKIYIIGGNAPTVTGSIAYADISGTTLSKWSETASLWQPRAGALSNGEGEFYIVGGSDDNGDLNNIEYIYTADPSSVNLAKGVILNSLYSIPHGSADIFDCGIYVIGGKGNADYLSKVEYLISYEKSENASYCKSFWFFFYDDYSSMPHSLAHGLLFTSQTAPSLNIPRYKLAAVNYNEFVYALGGYYTGTSITNSVEMAQVQTDGTLGNWQYTSPMNLPRAGFEAVAFSGWVYAVGGYTDKGITNTVEKAHINPDGSLGKWEFTSPMTTPRADLAVVENDGWIYALGGISKIDGPPLDTIEATKVTQ